MSRLLRFVLFGAFACSSPSASVLVTTGGENDTFTRNPAVASLLIEAVDSTGGRTTLKQAPYAPGAGIDLGNPSQSLVASLQLTGSDAQNNAIVWGAAPFAQLGVFDGTTVSLFVQRKGEWARMPHATADARSAPLLAATGRAVYYAGGALGGSAPLVIGGYDMLSLADFGNTCPAAATKSFALVLLSQANSDGEIAMAWRIDDSAINVVGLYQCTDYSPLVQLPTDGGVSWSDFAGGATVMGDDGSAYIVGPTRTSATSGTVFKIAPDASATTLLGVTANTFAISSRQGAATAWAPGRGVFVYGGATSSNSVGEIVSATGAATEISAPTPDTRQGLAAIAFDSTKTMLVAGDDNRPILVDLSCSGCAPTPWGVALPVPLSSPSLFSVAAGVFLIVGDDPTNATRAFRMTATTTTEEQLKIARSGARAIQIQTGSIVLLGGGSTTPESYVE